MPPSRAWLSTASACCASRPRPMRRSSPASPSASMNWLVTTTSRRRGASAISWHAGGVWRSRLFHPLRGPARSRQHPGRRRHPLSRARHLPADRARELPPLRPAARHRPGNRARAGEGARNLAARRLRLLGRARHQYRGRCRRQRARDQADQWRPQRPLGTGALSREGESDLVLTRPAHPHGHAHRRFCAALPEKFHEMRECSLHAASRRIALRDAQQRPIIA